MKTTIKALSNEELNTVIVEIKSWRRKFEQSYK